jgi:hypothetical protein
MTKEAIPSMLVPAPGSGGLLGPPEPGYVAPPLTPEQLKAIAEAEEREELLANGRWARQEASRESIERELEQRQRTKLEKAYAEYLQDCPEPETLETYALYEAVCRRFAQYCVDCSVSSVPCRPSILASYLNAHAQSGAPIEHLKTIVAGVRHGHQACGYADPTDELCEAVLRWATIHNKGHTNGNGHAEQKEDKDIASNEIH